MQCFGGITCAWVLLGSLQEQPHGPQRPGTPVASAAQDKLLGWFYGEGSEGKACSLSVQGLQWPFLGLSTRVNSTEKTVLQGNANREELFSINTEQNDTHFPGSTKIVQNICPTAYSRWPTFCTPAWSRISLHSEILNIFKGQERRQQPQVLPQFCLLADVKHIRRERKKREAWEGDEDWS